MLHVIHAMQLQTTFIIFPSYKTVFFDATTIFIFCHTHFPPHPCRTPPTHPCVDAHRRSPFTPFSPITKMRPLRMRPPSPSTQHLVRLMRHHLLNHLKTPASWNNFKAESQTTGDCDSSMTWSVTRACAKKNRHGRIAPNHADCARGIPLHEASASWGYSA